MIPTLVAPRRGSRRRWWRLVALIFLVQLALICWLGGSAPEGPRLATRGFTFNLAGSGSAELLALTDPTLFALPHARESDRPPQRAALPKSPSFQWPEPTSSLLLAVDQLGTAFKGFIKTNEFTTLQLPADLQPSLTQPDLPPLPPAVWQTTLRLEGDLARRRLITPLALHSWTNSEILTRSVIRLAVDREGRPISPTLLSTSGSREADQDALDQAQAARFEPLRPSPAGPASHPAADLTWGRMVFQWRTLPPPSTNSLEVTP